MSEEDQAVVIMGEDLFGRYVTGSGEAFVSRNGEMIYNMHNNPDGPFMTYCEAELIAQGSPDSEWIIRQEFGLRDFTFKRTGFEEWTLIQSGIGYA